MKIKVCVIKGSRLGPRVGFGSFDRVTIHPCLPGSCPGIINIAVFHPQKYPYVDYGLWSLGFDCIVNVTTGTQGMAMCCCVPLLVTLWS